MNVSLFRQHLALKHRHYVTENDSQPEYRAYFNGMMKKHGYDSPADIPDDKKKAFFDAVDKGYTAKNESTTLKKNDSQSEYRAYFNRMMKKHGYDSPADIPKDKRKAFFDAVDKGWSSYGQPGL